MVPDDDITERRRRLVPEPHWLEQPLQALHSLYWQKGSGVGVAVGVGVCVGIGVGVVVGVRVGKAVGVLVGVAVGLTT
jgi:hypothetical protein